MRPVILVLVGFALGGLVRSSHAAWDQAPAPSGTVITIAGDDGPATNAALNFPVGSPFRPDSVLVDFGDGREFSFSPASWRTSFLREENS